MSIASAGWRATTIGELGRYLNGRAFKSSEWGDAGRPIIRIQNLTGSGRTFNHFDGEVEDRYVVRPGDLLVSWAATLGAYFWTGPEAVLNQHIFKVESSIEPRFHKYLLDYKLAELQRGAHGSGMVHITRGRFDAVKVSVPGPKEQRRIVELLEDHLSRLDAAELSLMQAEARAATLEYAYVAQAFSRRLDGWRDVGVAEITAGDRSRSIIGPFGSDLTTKDYRDDGVPLVFVRNVVRRDFGSPTRFVSPEKAADLVAHGVRYGDLVIAKMGDPPGSAAVYDSIKPGIITADVIRLRPAEGFLSSYLMFAMQSPSVRQAMDRITSGVAQRKVSLARFRDHIQFPVPSIEKQTRIVNELSDLVADRTRLTATIESAQKRSSRLRSALLAAAFSGQLTGAASDADRIEELAAAP